MALNDAIQQNVQPVTQGAAQVAPQVAAQPVDDTTPTPEEQEAYERVVLSGVKALSDPASSPQIMQMLGNEQAGDPAERLAKTTSTIFAQLDEQSGGTIPEAVIINSAGEILANVVEFASEAGVIPADKQTLDRASQLLLIDLGNMYDFDPAEVQGLSEGMSDQDLQALVQEQDAAARGGSGAQAPQTAPQQPMAPQAAPQVAQAAPAQSPPQQKQKLPGIISQILGE